MLDPAHLFRFILRLGERIVEDGVPGLAAQIAYYFLFALFPFLLFLASLLAFLPVPDLPSRVVGFLRRLLPEQAYAMVEENAGKLVTERKGGILSFGILAALFSSTGGVTAAIDTLNRAYRVHEERSFLVVQATAAAMVAAFSLFIVTALALALFGGRVRRLAEKAGMERTVSRVMGILRWPLTGVLSFIPVAALFYFGPSVDQPLAAVLPGTFVTVLLWIAGSAGVSFYVDRFGSFDRTYGSIGAVIALLTWFYISGFVLLAGGEVNAILQGR